MLYSADNASMSVDPCKDYFAHQDRINTPETKAPLKVVCLNRQGDPHRMKRVGNTFVDDYASNYTLPDLDTIGWMRVELFHNKVGSGQCEWVLKFIINECDHPWEVNTQISTREVFYNLYHGRKLDQVLEKSKENKSFIRRFQDRIFNQDSRLKAQKMLRPAKQKKTNHVIDKVIAGFCYVKQAPWGTVTFPQQQAILLPGEGDNTYTALLSLNQNEQKNRMIMMHDVRNHKAAGKESRDENACVMVGYLDQVGYNDWRNGNAQ